MTFAPATLQRLADYWRQQGGVNLGVVGDTAHQARASYHNGQDAITRYGRTALDDYSIRLDRDREPHLTNAAAAIDLGKLNGSYAELRRFSNWLVAQCKASSTVRRDIREVIYSPDGRTVRRYSGPDNVVREGGGDSSHLTHTHISYYRDSELRDKVAVFAPFFGSDTSGDAMRDFRFVYDAAGQVVAGKLVVREDGVRYLDFAPTEQLKPIEKGVSKHGVRVRLLEPIVAGKPETDDWMLGYLWGGAAFILARNVTFTAYPTPPPAPKEYAVTVGGKAAGKVTLP